MTQRNDAAVMVLHDPSESDERQSVTRPIASVRETDESVSVVDADAADGGEVSHLSSEPSEVASATDAERGERPTLMGLAPVELGSEVSSSAAEQLNAAHPDEEQPAEREPETSTVRPAQWLTSDAEPPQHAEQPQQPANEELQAAEAPTSEAEPASSAGVELEAEGSALADEEPEQPAAASASAEPAQAPLQISMLMPTPEHASSARLPEAEGESEWLDLSTRWLVTTGPRAVQPVQPVRGPLIEETEVTDHAHWADRLSARVGARAEALSSAPPPPPQRAGTRRPTMGYGRQVPVAPVHANEAVPPAFDAVNQRHWAPPTRRHSTLAGISPLPEEPNGWPPARDPREFPASSAGDATRGIVPSGEPNPWREEPSYSDAPRPQAHGQAHGPSTIAASYAAPAGALPPWAATMSPYGAQPPAAMMPPYAPAAWSAPPVPPPWAATVNYGAPAPQYAPPERRPSRRTATLPAQRSHASHSTIDYALPPGASTSSASLRPVRAPQQHANEISFEQWKGMANTWFMTVGKLALAGMALHFSGLATPLLANFGYAPAPATTEHLLRPAVQTASIGAASVMPESATPEPLAKTKAEAEQEGEPKVAAAPAPRRSAAKRESSAASTTTTESATRRRSARPAHKAKPKSSARSKPARSAPAEAPAAAAVAPSADDERAQAEPLSAAPTKSADAVAQGTLRINSRPWSEIYIDGTHVGHTPKLDLKVSAGSHRVRLVNEELGLSKTLELDAPAGETVSHVELFIE